MSDHHLPNPSPPDVGEQNMERLLGKAYRPESPDPEFVQRVNAQLAAAAQSRTQSPPRSLRFPMLRRRVLTLVAVAAVLALVFILIDRLASPKGEVVLPDLAQNTPAPTPEHSGPLDEKRQANPSPERLVPRTRPKPLDAETLAVGGSLKTGSGERRRVTLPDGSVLFLNQKTVVRLDTERQVTLSSGEVYVEVAPRAQEDGEPARFVVKTPQREVTAVGTKFAVSALAPGTDVTVTQGKVRVDGLDTLLLAGQELPAGATEPKAAPRAAAVLDWTRELMCAAEAPLVPPTRYSGGALVAVDTATGQETRLSLRKYHVDVHIEDGFARTTIDQTYFNPEQRRLEGTFHFPLPADASLSRLAMYVNGTLMEGGMAEREHARQTYEGIVRKMQDPALLEWVDGTTFKMRVFPLEGRQEKRIVLSYTQRLPVNYGRSQYRFPSGHSLDTVRDWSFAARVKNGSSMSWASETHGDKLTATTEKDDLLLSGKQENVKLAGDLVVDLFDGTTKPRTDAAVRFSSAEYEGARYLMVRYRPDLGARAAREGKERRDWVFLFESSGDREPLLARVQVDMIRELLANAEHSDTFTILTAGTHTRSLWTEPRPVTAENVGLAMRHLESTHLIGALDLTEALGTAEPFLKAAKNPFFVHVGGAHPTLGATTPDALLKQIPANTRYVGIGVGKRWNRSLMKTAAEKTGGFYTQVNPDERIAWRAFELYSTLTAPRLLDAHVIDAAEKVSFLTHTPVVAQGEEVCAVARIEQGAAMPESVTVTGTLDGQTFTKTVPVKDVHTNAGYLPRTWAKLEIDRLLAENAEGNKARIIPLSMSSYVMTPYTSLLVLENEQMYQQFNVDRGRKDHWAMYPCPATIPVVFEPITGQVETKKAPVPAPSVEQILATLAVRLPAPVFRGDENGGARAVTVRDLAAGSYAVPVALDSWDDAEDEKGAKVRRERSEKPGKDDSLRDPSKGDPKSGRPTQSKSTGGSGSGAFPGGFTNPFHGPAISPPSPYGIGGGYQGGIGGVNGQLGGQIAGIGGIGGQIGGIGGMPYGGGGGNGAFAPRLGGFPGGSGMVPGSYPAPVAPVTATPPIEPGLAPPVPVSLTTPAIGGPGPGLPPVGATTYPPAFFQPTVTGSTVPVNPYGNLLPYQTSGTSSTTNNYYRMISPGYQYETHSASTNQLSKEQADLLKKATEELRRYAPLSETKDSESKRLQTEDLIRQQTKKLFDGGVTYDKAKLDRDPRSNLETKSKDPNEDLALLIRLLEAQQEVAQRLQAGANGSPVATGSPFGHFRPQGLVYRRPNVSPDGRSFMDLLNYAPALNTTWSDILGVLENEAEPDPAAAPGTIDPAAEALIDGARGTGWRTLAIPATPGVPGWQIAFDGSGRFAYDRVLPCGLKEVAVCDGRELLHLYPELGLGARRKVTRFHRAELAELVPWTLPPAKDLARGFDLKSSGEHSVILRPCGLKDDQPAVVQQLVFDGEGRLAERQLLELSKKTVLSRETYGTDGTMKRLDDAGNVVHEQKLAVKAGRAPDLDPETKELVVLPLPLRTRDHLLAQPAANGGNLETMNNETALALLAIDAATGDAAQLQIEVTQRFWNRADQRPGLAALYLSLGFDPNTVPHAKSKHPFHRYVQWLGRNEQKIEPSISKDLGDGLLKRVVEAQAILRVWRSRQGPVTADEVAATVKYVREARSPVFAWAVVEAVLDAPGTLSAPKGHTMQDVRSEVLTAACASLKDVAGLGYAARYEHARHLFAIGDRTQARRLFTELYEQAAESGVRPPIDRTFREAMKGQGDEPDLFAKLLGDGVDRLVKDGRRISAVAQAWLAWDLGDAPLADALLKKALAGLTDTDRCLPTLVAVDYLWQTHQYDGADRLMQGLLESPAFKPFAMLWRMGYHVALQRRQPARAYACLAEALELEYRAAPVWIDLDAVRRDYGQLLGHYEQTAHALQTLQEKVPDGLVAHVVRAADRWRALDVDGTAACQAASRILRALGEKELAWDYLLTAAVTREGFAWRELAQSLAGEAEYDLAERAYERACAVQPADPTLIAERAQNLRWAGKPLKARELSEAARLPY